MNDDLAKRVRRLEQVNLALFAMIVIGGMVAAVRATEDAKFGIVTARRFVMQDAKDRNRAILGDFSSPGKTNSAGLQLLNIHEKSNIGIITDDDELVTIAIGEGRGKSHLVLYQKKGQVPGFLIQDGDAEVPFTKP